MLLYHPVEDANHCCYRLMRLLYSTAAPQVTLTNLFICDFYSMFPGQLKYIQGWPRGRSANWKMLQNIGDEYEEMLNPKRVFFQLRAVQAAAISHLQSKKLIIFRSASEQEIAINHDAIPPALLSAIDEDSLKLSSWFKLVVNDLLVMPILGEKGLKSRTGLMEYVYD